MHRKPLFTIEAETDAEGGGTDTEGQESEESTTAADSADESQESQEDGDTASDDEPDDTFDAARALAKIKKANSEAKTQRERAKSAEEKVKGLEPAKREAALQRVARRLNLPDNDEVDAFLDRLKGETVDELAEDAEKLLSLLAPKESKSTTRKPKEALRGGGAPDDEPTELDPDKLAESVIKARGY